MNSTDLVDHASLRDDIPEFAAGDTLAILESMKMEIPIEAEEDGTVEKVLIAEGDLVDEDVAILTYV